MTSGQYVYAVLFVYYLCGIAGMWWLVGHTFDDAHVILRVSAAVLWPGVITMMGVHLIILWAIARIWN